MEPDKKMPLSKKSIILRLVFIIAYSIVLYYLYFFFINLGIEHLVIILILIFLILIVIGPLITGMSKALYNRFFPRKEKKPEKSDYQIYKEQLKNIHQETQIQPIDTKDINLDFKYRKSIIRRCSYCKIIVPNFVKKCPNCGKPIID